MGGFEPKSGWPPPQRVEPTLRDRIMANAGTWRDQWRVSWWHWSPDADGPSTPKRIYDDEATARQHLEGLQSMLAPHELRPCADHVWRPSLEHRTIWESPWHDQSL
jgi:hypothetical protein